MIPLEELITPEQLLKYAVNNYNTNPDCEISEDIISWYIFSKNDEISEEDFHKEFHRYVSEYTLVSLCEKGVIEYDFLEGEYHLTKNGEKFADDYKKHIGKNPKQV